MGYDMVGLVSQESSAPLINGLAIDPTKMWDIVGYTGWQEADGGD